MLRVLLTARLQHYTALHYLFTKLNFISVEKDTGLRPQVVAVVKRLPEKGLGTS